MISEWSSEDEPDTKRKEKNLENLLWSLRLHKLVKQTTVKEDNILQITAPSDNKEKIDDIVRAHNSYTESTLEKESNLCVTIVKPSLMSYAGENDIRTRGDSYIVSIPPDVIRNSDIEYEESVEFYSRDSEFLMIPESKKRLSEDKNNYSWEYKGKNTVRRSGSSYIIAVPPNVIKSTSFDTGTTAMFYSDGSRAKVNNKKWVSSYNRSVSNN